MSHTLKKKVLNDQASQWHLLSQLERAKLIHTLEDLLVIAQLAMPDTYFLSDTRIRRARLLIEKLRATQ